jgi:hypothetical protein
MIGIRAGYVGPLNPNLILPLQNVNVLQAGGNYVAPATVPYISPAAGPPASSSPVPVQV